MKTRDKNHDGIARTFDDIAKEVDEDVGLNDKPLVRAFLKMLCEQHKRMLQTINACNIYKDDDTKK